MDVAPGSADFLPNIVHRAGARAGDETLILRFDLRGFGVSGSSACSSYSLAPSHVLHALGIDDDRAHGALRISGMGRGTTEEDERNPRRRRRRAGLSRWAGDHARAHLVLPGHGEARWRSSPPAEVAGVTTSP